MAAAALPPPRVLHRTHQRWQSWSCSYTSSTKICPKAAEAMVVAMLSVHGTKFVGAVHSKTSTIHFKYRKGDKKPMISDNFTVAATAADARSVVSDDVSPRRHRELLQLTKLASHERLRNRMVVHMYWTPYTPPFNARSALFSFPLLI